jgi:competence protein ComGC
MRLKCFCNTRGFTVVEFTVLLFIGILVLGIAIPKFIMASHMRKSKEVALILNRVFEAQFVYQREHGKFAADIHALDLKESDLKSKWFAYSVTYATHDTFFVKASVKRPFGEATTDDWAGISSAKIRSISNRDTFGKYAVEWVMLMKKDEKRREKRQKKST